MFKLLKLLPVAMTLMMVGCGRGEGGADAVQVQGVAVPGSSLHGLALALRDVDQSQLTSNVYYYDFAAGMLQRVVAAASQNPALFYADGRVFLFNRTEQQQDFVSFDPKSAATPATSPVALTDLAPGDPFDVVPLASGKSLLLASLKGFKLQALDYTTGELTSLTDGLQFSGVEFRPRALYRSGDTLGVLQTATTGNGALSADSEVYTAKVSASGALTFNDQDPASDGIVDGLKITASNPSGFFDAAGTSALVVGLCPSQAAASTCTAASDHVDLAAHKATAVAAYGANFKYEFLNQIVDGPDAKTVYAHVRSPLGGGQYQYQVIRLDTETKAATPVHTFPDERLYGIAYDKSTHTLIVGGQDGLTGQMILYRDDQEVERFDVDGVLYASAAVPK